MTAAAEGRDGSIPEGFDGDSRKIGAAGFSPITGGRRQRRKAIQEARHVETDARKAALAQRRQETAERRYEQKTAQYLPPGGETGPGALRSWRRLRLPPHRATSEVLGGAYPFLADAGLGSQGVLIGLDSWSGAAFVFDPWVLYRKGVLTNPNVVLAGIIGRGKSTLAKALATRSIAFGRRVYVPGDPKGEWSPVARAVGGQTIALGSHSANRLNPLDPGPSAGAGHGRWQAETRRRRRGLLGSLTESVLARPLAPTEHSALDAALDTVTATSTEPTLPLVVEALFEPRQNGSGSTVEQLRADGREIGHALARLVYGDLTGLFDGPSTVAVDPTLPMVTLDLSGISGSDTLISLVMTCASTWMEAALADPAGGNRWVIYDEAWRLLRQPSLLARMQSQWKLSRALGIANLMVIHRLSDLDAVGEDNSQARNLALGLLADCSTKIIYAQEPGEAARTGAALGLTSAEVAQLADLEQGEGLWRVGQRSYMARHTCTDAELALFDTSQRMLGIPS
jgi:nucleotide-binding universal stress UspA family protein